MKPEHDAICYHNAITYYGPNAHAIPCTCRTAPKISQQTDAQADHDEDCKNYSFQHHAATGGDAPCICKRKVPPGH
jgi:hypothetical protein